MTKGSYDFGIIDVYLRRNEISFPTAPFASPSLPTFHLVGGRMTSEARDRVIKMNNGSFQSTRIILGPRDVLVRPLYDGGGGLSARHATPPE